MSAKLKSYENTAKTVIKNLEKRGMEGFYCLNRDEARKKVLELMKEGSIVSWGGSESLEEAGVIEAVRLGNYQAIDRKTAQSPEEQRQLYGRIVCADYYLMSTNAITIEGELVNIDGNGNRVACLINGPKHVIIVAGMNKLVRTAQDGINRVHTLAGPPNGVRIGVNTPCVHTGVCSDCLSKDSMCCHTVVTRMSRQPGRIKVILVGEELGF